MSKSSELFIEMMASNMDPDQYFAWLNGQSEEVPDDAKELIVGNKPTLEDLDNLFTIDEDEQANN